jgi:hypothetical protein
MKLVAGRRLWSNSSHVIFVLLGSKYQWQRLVLAGVENSVRPVGRP